MKDKLIKLSETHYIVVDDSVIKEEEDINKTEELIDGKIKLI
jgi:hypothetical protein